MVLNRAPALRTVTKPMGSKLRTIIITIIAIMVVQMVVEVTAMGHRMVVAMVVRMATMVASSSIRTMFSGHHNRYPFCRTYPYSHTIHPQLLQLFNNFLNLIIQVAYLTPVVAKMACSRWIPIIHRLYLDNSHSTMPLEALVVHPAAAVASWAAVVVAWRPTPAVIPAPIVITNLRLNIKIKIPTIVRHKLMPTAAAIESQVESINWL